MFCIDLHINLNPGTFCKPCVLFGCALGGGARVLLFVELFTVFVAGGCACVNILMLYCICFDFVSVFCFSRVLQFGIAPA